MSKWLSHQQINRVDQVAFRINKQKEIKATRSLGVRRVVAYKRAETLSSLVVTLISDPEVRFEDRASSIPLWLF